jgi:uncharacterized protein (DUF4415 family)
LAKVDRLTDEDIDYSDIPPLDKAFLAKAVRVPWPPTKRQLTIRLDEDVLEWLKSLGKGYQTRINRILRVAMEGRPGQSAVRRGSSCISRGSKPKRRRAV